MSGTHTFSPYLRNGVAPDEDEKINDEPEVPPANDEKKSLVYTVSVLCVGIVALSVSIFSFVYGVMKHNTLLSLSGLCTFCLHIIWFIENFCEWRARRSWNARVDARSSNLEKLV